MPEKKDRDDRRRTIGAHVLKPESLMMSYGYDPKLSEGAVKVPLFQTSTFVFNTAEEGKAFFELAYGLRERKKGEEPGLIYSRLNNPDLEVLEDRLTLWNNADDALVFASGMAAISTTILTFLRPGQLLLYSTPVYGGTEFLVTHILPQFGITGVPFAAGPGPGALEAALAQAPPDRPVGMIYIETPANPTNALVDISACTAAAARLGEARQMRPLVVIDNTFLGPLWQDTLALGADLEVYSLTKYIGGHSDLIAGGVLGGQAHIDALRGMRTILGTMPDPHTSWLLMRSLETLKLRMTSSMKNARYVAEFLADHPKVRRVAYLGFLTAADPAFEVYQRQCRAPGSTFSFEIHGGETEAFRVLNALQLCKLAVSLGGTETLVEHPGTMTHSDIPMQEQLQMGITPGLIRISVGIEHPEDVIADLAQALSHA